MFWLFVLAPTREGYHRVAPRLLAPLARVQENADRHRDTTIDALEPVASEIEDINVADSEFLLELAEDLVAFALTQDEVKENEL